MQNEDQNKSKVKTDLNDRERAKFAETFRHLSKFADQAAKSLQNGNDDELMKNFMMFSLSFLGIKELADILSNAVVDTKASQSDEPEFPEMIFP